MSKSERVRFAPSPTGHLHVGNARTALFNFLFAAQNHGSLIVRIEDTDVERSAAEYERNLIEALHWLGLCWQEGPECGGTKGPYRQSERLDFYRWHARLLFEQGKTFHCYCLDAELEAHRQACLSQGKPPRYSGKCRDLSPRQRSEMERGGRVPCIRYRVDERRLVRFQDLIHGPMKFHTEEIGDFVLMRSSGMPSYNFAVVVDDHSMEISTVIRGDDHLANTPRQVLLYETFGWEVPRFAHHALLLGPDRTKLSKRHGVTSVEAFRAMGILPEALVNYLALPGGSPVLETEIFGSDALVRGFSLQKVGRSAAIFDLQKLLWMNQQHLQRQPSEPLAQHMALVLEKAGYRVSGRDPRWLAEVAKTLVENVQTLAELALYAPIFFSDTLDYAPEVRRQLRDGSARAVLEAFRGRFQASPGGDSSGLAQIFKDLRQELNISPREMFMPLRLALTGMAHGPGLDRILRLLAPEVILQRLTTALADTA
jgi:nondiscriminating glutamyl-tRNA synthetase